MKMKEVFLGIGTNQGNRERNLYDSLGLIEQYIGLVNAYSPVFETEPWGFESDENFFNMVICVKTNLNPRSLLEKTLFIESYMGRIREEGRYISRVIDIDILFYDDQVIDEADLKIPHPRIAVRRFVLEPLCEIAPGFIHPVCKISLSAILESCTDTSRVIYRGNLSDTGY